MYAHRQNRLESSYEPTVSVQLKDVDGAMNESPRRESLVERLRHNRNCYDRLIRKIEEVMSMQSPAPTAEEKGHLSHLKLMHRELATALSDLERGKAETNWMRSLAKCIRDRDARP